MQDYQLSSTPSFPVESGQVLQLLGRFKTAEERIDSQDEVFVGKLVTLQTNPDGSVVTRNADGIITTVVLSTGTVINVEYDSNGTVIQFNDVLNNVYKLENDYFQQYDSNGIATGMALEENEVDLDYEGNLTLYHPNGSSTIAKTDGSVIEVDSAGQILQVNYADGRTAALKYDATGEVTSIVDVLTGEALILDEESCVLVDALGLITLIKNGLGYLWRTDGECFVVDLEKSA